MNIKKIIIANLFAFIAVATPTKSYQRCAVQASYFINPLGNQTYNAIVSAYQVVAIGESGHGEVLAQFGRLKSGKTWKQLGFSDPLILSHVRPYAVTQLYSDSEMREFANNQLEALKKSGTCDAASFAQFNSEYYYAVKIDYLKRLGIIR